MTFYPLDHALMEHQYNGVDWQDFTGDVVSVSVVLREFDGKHTGALTFYNAAMDPAQGTGSRVIKEGDRLRIWTDNAAGVSRKMATFTVRKVQTTIDLAKPPGRQYLVAISFHGQGFAGVAGSGQSKGVDTLDDLSDIITGAPFEIGGDGFGSGRTTAIGTSTEVAYTEVASELDQILITRDSNPGTVVFEDPDGRIQVYDSAVHRTAPPTIEITAADYSHIDMRGVDSSTICNVLVIKYLEKIKTSGKATRTVEHDHTYIDTASRAKYGPHKKIHKVHKKIDFGAYADKVFAAHADPPPVPRSVVIPVRETSELRPGYADGHFVGTKVKVWSPDGLTSYVCRVTRITHQIDGRRWLVQVFLAPPTVVRHRRRSVNTEVANTPDGMILTPHIDDAAVDLDKLADNAVDDRVLAPGTVDGTHLADDIDGTGKVITSAMYQTSDTGTRMIIADDTSGGIITFWHDIAGEFPGIINPQLGPVGQPELALRASTNPTNNVPVGLTLSSGSSAGGHQPFVSVNVSAIGVFVIGSAFSVNNAGDVVAKTVHATGTIDANGAMSCTGLLSGSDIEVAGAGNTVQIDAAPTSTSAANVRMGTTGKLNLVTSLSRHKLEQQPLEAGDVAGLLALTPKTWFDRAEVEDNGGSTEGLRRIPGLVAEDVAEHAPELALYDAAGDLQGVAYDRVAALLLPIIADQQTRLEALERRVEALTHERHP